MTKFLAMRKLGALRPIDEAGIEALSHVGEGEIIQVSYSRPRSLKMHRMFWALMTIVWSNLDHGRYPTVENLVAAVKISTGHRELIVLPGGAEVYVPKSISFAAMDQDEFNAFYNRVCDLIAAHWLPGVTSEELRAEVKIMIGAA